MNKYILIALTLLLFAGVSKAQVIDVCGTDSIILRVDNYQYGTIQWQKSYDNTTWTNIDGAKDTTYHFMPQESNYYRAVVKFSECPPEYSEVSFVQMPPEAHAGSDRVVPGTSVFMMANEPQGATGSWSIIQGSGGSFVDPQDPETKFTGNDSLYTLVWQLTNSCGTSTDTIHLRFRQNQYISSIAVVDSTDQILSDSLQMDTGIYVINFSSPAPSITDSTVMLGLVNDGFIRKVDSFHVNSSTYTIYTSQGSLEDITISGAYDLAQVFSIDSTLSATKSHNMTRLSHCPTREELMTDPKFQHGNYYYVVEDKPTYIRKGVSINNTNTAKGGGALIDLSFNNTLFSTSNATLSLDGSYTFNPNLVADLDYKWLNLKYFKLGMQNGTIERNYKLTLSASSSANLMNQTFTLLTLKKNIVFVLGGVPVLIQAEFNVDGQVSADVSASMNISHEYTKTSTYNALIKYEYQNWDFIYNKSDSVQNNNNFTVSGDLTQAFDIGPNLTFKIYGVVGPYIDSRLTEDLTLCAYNNNWKATMNLGGSLSVGAKAEVLGGTLLDKSKTWSQSFYNLQFPYNLEMISGNNQNYDMGNALPNKIKVKVTSNKGFSIPGALVHFDAKDGGSVSQATVTTNAGGYAEIDWTPAGSSNSQLEVYLLDCNGNNINNSPQVFQAYENAGGTNCAQSSLSANVVKNGNTLTVQGQMGNPPYEYSTDGNSYSSTVPQVIITSGQTYDFYVKDSDGCVASESYTASSNPCLNSSLSLNLSVTGYDITANAHGGNPPYEYSLDGTANYGSSNTFTNVSTGTHTVYVRDSINCTTNDIFTIYSNSQINFLVNDNFDSYSIGNFPIVGGWYLFYSGYGLQYQVVTNQESISAPNSLKLEGASNWSANAVIDLNTSQRIIHYECYVKPIKVDSSQMNYSVTRVGFYNPNNSTWGTYYAMVDFRYNYKIRFAGKEIQSYTNGKWYKVKVRYDVINKKASLWIDDVLKAYNENLAGSSGSFSSFLLFGGHDTHTKSYFDNVKVW